jgi:hypothetical protein
MINTIRTLISKAMLEQALDVAYDVFNNSRFQNTIIGVCQSFNTAVEHNNQGFLNGESYLLELRKITSRLINIISDIERDSEELQRIESAMAKGKFLKWKSYYDLYEIQGAKNVSTGIINAQQVIIGDNNFNMSGVGNAVVQIHNGYGDNIGGDKVVIAKKQPIPEPGRDFNDGPTSIYTAQKTTVTVELSSVIRITEQSSAKLIRSIFDLMCQHFLVKMEFAIVFPDLAKEAGEIYDYLQQMATDIIESDDLNRVDEIRDALPEIQKGIEEFYARATKILKTAKNSETSLVLTALAAEVPTLKDFAKAYKHLKEMGLEHKVEEIKTLPTNKTLVLMKKNQYIKAAKDSKN